MNKIYSVLRIDNWDRSQSVYEGRIRDCKKSLKTIAEEYKKRGWRTKLYDYTLIIKPDSQNEKQYIYLISDSNSLCETITSASIDLTTPVSLSAITAIVSQRELESEIKWECMAAIKKIINKKKYKIININTYFYD